jgi:DNA-directed RNA polymerase subunit beta'
VLEYFISTHGARKGLADTALKTADSGYLTRKLVDVAQDVIITEQDCGTLNGIEIKPIWKATKRSSAPPASRPHQLDDIRDPVHRDVIVARPARRSTRRRRPRIAKAGIESLRIRSVLTCESRAAAAPSATAATWPPAVAVAKLGESVGIIAAQSIGEPGTQLTMRTFHIGGTAIGVQAAPDHRQARGRGPLVQDLRTVQPRKAPGSC